MKNALKGLFLYETDSRVRPLMDLYETEEEVVCEVDLPGADPENISVRMFKDLLVIEGLISDAETASRLKYLCMERGLKDFRRVIRIPVSVNSMGAKAVYQKGVLTVRLPKFKWRLIDIKVERTAV